MDRSAVLAKTAKGLEEVKSRAHGLPQKQRTILIMVDGVASVGDIVAKFGGIPEIAAALDALVRGGFVEVRRAGSGSTAPSAAAPPPAIAVAGPPTAPQSRAEALSVLTRFLHDHLGPDADLVTGALEKARTPAEFTAAAERCAGMLAAVRGAQKAQVFRDRASAFAATHLGG
ncbi:MAG: hypothetical protein U1F45_07850 [Burkholderiales bacterium]